jgi:hypothetical protein
MNTMNKKLYICFFWSLLILGSASADTGKDSTWGDLGKAVIVADAQHPPTLPDNSDLYTIKYKLRNSSAAVYLARLVRSFTPASSRIFPLTDTGTLQVTDTADSLRKVYVLIKNNDLEPTPEIQRKWQELEKVADQKNRP